MSVELITLKAAILVGGAGTRLSPLTTYVPKAMIPLGGKLVIDHILDFLTRYAVRDVVLLTSTEDYPAISNYLRDGSYRGMKVEYDVRDRVGTAGALGAASSHFSETFLIYYGDVLLDFDLSAEIKFHKDHNATLTITLSKSVPIEYGVAQMEPDGRVKFFKEKPVLPEYPVSTGIFVAEPSILRYCLPGTDLSSDVIPHLLEDKLPVYGFAIESRHYDIGTFKTLEEVAKLMKQNNHAELPPQTDK
jgi:mannose-1-phosphate guanylyltransferase/phosphomannomutase